MDEEHDSRVKGYLALAQAVGNIVIQWSLIEQQVDSWVSIVFKQCEGHKLRKNQDIPRMFDEKKKFLKTCFKTIPLLSPFKDEGLAILARAAHIANDRHTVTHGVLVNFVPENGIFHFRILKTEKDHHIEKIVDFKPSNYPRLDAELGELGERAIRLSDRLSNAFLNP